MPGHAPGGRAAGALAAAGVVVLVTAPISASAATAAAVTRPGGSAAAASSGTMMAWGANSGGELGDGTTTARSQPVRVHLGKGIRVTSARAGCSHTIALTGAGKVLAWGHGGDGELGNGKDKGSKWPVRVRLPQGTKVTSVRAGCAAAYALTSTGRVLAWGDNFFGQLGNGHAGGHSNVPVRVRLPGGTKVTAISAGNGHGLALTRAGRVYAWGDDSFGQLGDRHTRGKKGTPVLVRLPGASVVTAVAAGEIHSMALTRSGRVLAWGDNQAGELGNGHMGGRSGRPAAVQLAAGVKVRGLFGGCLDSLALTADGSVLAWGANNFGELGDGTTTDGATPVTVQITPGTKVTAVAAGCEHDLARTVDGGLLAWGNNTQGQLGDGSPGDSLVPVPVKLPHTVFPLAIASGPDASFSLAIVEPAA
jgi:alpha-tubulin suppressor-like RCC1 family protein